MSDVRLVALAYAFEQSGARRRAPSTTPQLVRGVAPVPSTMLVRATAPQVAATARLTFDAPTSMLRWSVQLDGTSVDDVVAVVLRRGNDIGTAAVPAQSVRVMTRLLGPGMRRASGSLQLNGAERRALVDGRITLALYTRRAAAPVEMVIRAKAK